MARSAGVAEILWHPAIISHSDNFNGGYIMEILKRKIEAERQENQDEISVSLIDGMRLCLRWHNKDKEDEDMLVNFTEKETRKIKNIFNGEN